MQFDYIETLESAAKAFNFGDYWGCHEHLELIWKAAEQPEKTYIQGLIQVCAGLHHLKKEAISPAFECFSSAQKKLSQMGALELIYDFEISNVVDFLKQVVSINKSELKNKWPELAKKMKASIRT